jgi:hypothetical protein
MAVSPRWKSALNVARVNCRRNRTKRVDRHGAARYSSSLMSVRDKRAGEQSRAN